MLALEGEHSLIWGVSPAGSLAGWEKLASSLLFSDSEPASRG